MFIYYVYVHLVIFPMCKAPQEEERSQADDVIASMKPGPVVGSYTIAARSSKRQFKSHFNYFLFLF